MTHEEHDELAAQLDGALVSISQAFEAADLEEVDIDALTKAWDAVVAVYERTIGPHPHNDP
jgi:hypothetical protein